MDVMRFLAGKPCLEEVDGYLNQLRKSGEVEITADVLVPLEEWKQTLLKGKDVPYEVHGNFRKYMYKKGSPPRLKPGQEL